MAYPDDFDPRRLEVPRWALSASDAADDAEGDLRDLRAGLRKLLPLAERLSFQELSVGALDADEIVGLLKDALEGDDRAVAAKNRERIMDNAREAME